MKQEKQEINVAILGCEFTGKSQIFGRIQNLNFNEDHHTTHGTNIKVIEYKLDDGFLKLKLRDTPGMDKYLEF